MRRCVLIFLIGFATISHSQNTVGIQFQNSDWTAVLAKAKKEKKFIFLDMYTTWCGPCKWMDVNIFPNKDVGEFINKNFISAKFDAEKGEGVSLAERNKVHSYPTYLFFNSEGDLVHKIGYAPGTANKFIMLANKALYPESQFISLLNKYENGSRDPELLFNLSYRAIDALSNRSATEFAHEYLKTQINWLTEKNLQFISDFTFNETDTLFKFMRKNRNAFIASSVGIEKYENILFWAVYNDISTKIGDASIPTGDQLPGLFKKAEQYFQKVLPELTDRLMAVFCLDNYRMTKQWEKYAEAANDYVSKKLILDPSKVNSIAWNVANHVDDEQLLNQALNWVTELKSIEETADNNYVLALLYSKLKDREKAIRYAKRSIEISTGTGAEKAEVEKLLAELEDSTNK